VINLCVLLGSTGWYLKHMTWAKMKHTIENKVNAKDRRSKFHV